MLLTGPDEPLHAYQYDPSNPDFVPSFNDGRFPESQGEGNPQAFTFNDNNRWRNTVTNGGGLQQGDPTTLTWSLVRDGVNIPTGGEPASPNDLIAMLGGIHGVTTDDTNFEDEAWFPLFTSYLDRFGEFSGLSYVYEPNDDGAAFAGSPGELGVRGDIRIAGHLIDGPSSVLAYNFFPNNGDMVIDTGDVNFYSNSTNNFVRTRNVLAHEHGHGLGIGHVCPVIRNEDGRLMEPFINASFDGPQFDDILAVQRGYGDFYEKNGGNDSVDAAQDLGFLADEVVFRIGTDAIDNRVAPEESDFISIDDDSDVDYYRFSIDQGASVTIDLIPRGPTYLSGPQNSDGSCSAGTDFDASMQSDLTIELIDTDGTTVLTLANDGGLGESEMIQTGALADGAYYLRVTGDADAAQMYELNLVALGSGGAAPANDFARVEPFEGFAAESTDNTGLFVNAIDVDDFTVELAAGDKLSAYLDVVSGSVTASLEIPELSLTAAATAPGAGIVLPTTLIPSDGIYTFRLSSDGTSDYDLTLFKNVVSETTTGDSDAASPVDIMPSSIDAAEVVRLGAIGDSAGDDVDVFALDLSGHAGRSFSILLHGLDGTDFSGQQLELLASDGTTVVATASDQHLGQSLINADLGIFESTVPTDGVHFLRLTTVGVPGQYGIAVAIGAEFEAEPNDTGNVAEVQQLSPNQTVAGFLDATDSQDWYRITLTLGETVTFTTTTHRVTAVGTPVNSLNPALTVTAADGTVLATEAGTLDNGNAALKFAAPASGTYFVRVDNEAGDGQYQLTTSQSPVDLFATIFDATTDHVPDGIATVAVTVRNNGTEASVPFNVKVVWSGNDILGDEDDFDAQGTISFPAIDRRSFVKRSGTVTLDKARLHAHATRGDGDPADDVSYLFAVVDPADDVEERNETNNSARGFHVDSDDITYSTWDTDGNGFVTPRDALRIIAAINSSDLRYDRDGNGAVTPLDALEAIIRIGQARNESVIEPVPEFVVADDETNGGGDIANGATSFAFPPAADSESLFLDDEEQAPLQLAVQQDNVPLDSGFEEGVDWLSVI